jgi:non-ribosomal peptide synthetase component F
MYTSGSTGTPKGVAVPHRGVIRLVRATNYIQFVSHDRVAQVSKVSFDAATFEIWGALLNGAQLVIITRDVALSPVDFARELKEQRISAIFLTSALFSHLVHEVPGAFETVKTGHRWRRSSRSELRSADCSPIGRRHGYSMVMARPRTPRSHVVDSCGLLLPTLTRSRSGVPFRIPRSIYSMNG